MDRDSSPDKNQHQDTHLGFNFHRAYKNTTEAYEALGVDILSVEIGCGLIPIADPDQGGELIFKIAGLRAELTESLGYVIPQVRVLDNLTLGLNEYQIKLRGIPVAQGVLVSDRVMIQGPQKDALVEDALQSTDPLTGEPCYWVKPKSLEPGSDEAKNAIEPSRVITTHLREVALSYVDDILSHTSMIQIVEMAQQLSPSLMEGLAPEVLDYGDLRKIWVNLIQENVSVKDILFIFERLSDYARFSSDPYYLSERLRASMARSICHQVSNGKREIVAVVLDAPWEQMVDQAYQSTEMGYVLLLNPAQVESLLTYLTQRLNDTFDHFQEIPVLVCAPRIRLALRQLLQKHLQEVGVMSFNEIAPEYTLLSLPEEVVSVEVSQCKTVRINEEIQPVSLDSVETLSSHHSILSSLKEQPSFPTQLLQKMDRFHIQDVEGETDDSLDFLKNTRTNHQ
ncbi:MAG: flagellar biosynthesis protein FlhA [Cyanobacteria bacterium]|nr:flagellar biosynthesis protein FlhA [Cyanobacteriota bacterium]